MKKPEKTHESLDDDRVVTNARRTDQWSFFSKNNAEVLA